MLAGLVRPSVEGFGKEKDAGYRLAVERAEAATEGTIFAPSAGVTHHWLAFRVEPPKGSSPIAGQSKAVARKKDLQTGLIWGNISLQQTDFLPASAVSGPPLKRRAFHFCGS